MKFRISIFLLTVIIFRLNAEYNVLPPGPQPAIYLDFEYHGGDVDSANPAFHSKAPGIWNGNSNIGSSTIGYCAVADSAGVDGYDCLDKTSVSVWGQSGAFVSIGSDAEGYDNQVEDSLDNLWSFTVSGWFKIPAGSQIGGNGRIFYRSGQFDLYAPDGDDTGKLALKIPAGSGSNTADIIVLSDNAFDYNNKWMFFAVTYDGTQTSGNVKFFTADKNSSVVSAGSGNVDAGVLTGGEHLHVKITGGGDIYGQYACGGYFDKFMVHTSSYNNDSTAALDLGQLEDIRKWQLRQPLDIETSQTNEIEVMLLDSMTKIDSVFQFTPEALPYCSLDAARGENEHFQIAIKAVDGEIDNIELTPGIFSCEDDAIPMENIKVRRADKVRVGIGYDELLYDPLVNKNYGKASDDDILLFWVSFDVPITQSSGIYDGNVVINIPGGDAVVVAVEVDVWDITIPRKQRFQTSFNLLRQCLRNYYGGDWDDPTDLQYRQWLAFCTDYRISPIDMSMGESSSHRFVKITRKLDRSWEFDFTDYNSYLDYCYNNGMANFNIGDLNWHFWKPFYGYDEIRGEYREFNLLTSQYEDVFAQYLTEAANEYRMDGQRPYEQMAFFYAFDELHTGMPEVLQECTDRHDAVEAVWPALHTLSTSEPLRYPAYEGHIDIWCGKIPNYYQYTQPEVARLRALGNDFWTYVTGYAPPYCNLEINEPGIEHRLIFWQNWVEDIDGFLHWGLNVWPHYRRPNAWVGDFPVEAEYDKWPNRAWDDGGWVIQEFTDGGGYLIYPSPDGPVASIRLEMMRDGLEDWELINFLSMTKTRAFQDGVNSVLIADAEVALDVSDTVIGFDDYSSDHAVLQTRRETIAAALSSLIEVMGSQKSAEFNGDQQVGQDDIIVLASKWLDSGIEIDCDLNYDETVDAADLAIFADVYYKKNVEDYTPSGFDIYLPFENTNDSYGAGSTDNPAWSNIALNDAPGYIGNSQPAYPRITTDGIKGDGLYATDPAMIGLNTVTFNWSGQTADVFDNVQSYTVCGWLNTRNSQMNGSGSYIVRCVGGGITIKWRDDGRLQVLDSVDGSWRYAGWGEGYSNDEWVFFAITRSSEGIKFYFGDQNTSVAAGNSVTGLTLSATSDCTRLVFGGYTYNGTDNYLNCDIDEIRVFVSEIDDSGALEISALEDIRKFDID
ncbi:MAG: glycoside hydrolase domain-containing protein [Sedimentisphaeraceae bacterium JB056]